MKKLPILLLAFVFAFASCSKSSSDATPAPTNTPEVFPSTKQALFLYYTGSECNPCGSIGIPNYYSVINDLNIKNKVIPICVHCNAPAADAMFDSKTGNDLLQLIIVNNSYSAPTYLIPPNAMFYGTDPAAVSQSDSYINAIAAQTPAAVANVSATYDKNTLTWSVKTRTKFLSDDIGDFKVAVWVIEDGVSWHQLVNGSMVNPFVHDQVLRGRFSTNTFGDDIKNGAVKAGDIIEQTVLGQAPTGQVAPKIWNINNLSACVVIYKYVANATPNTIVLNAYKIKLPVQ